MRMRFSENDNGGSSPIKRGVRAATTTRATRAAVVTLLLLVAASVGATATAAGEWIEYGEDLAPTRVASSVRRGDADAANDHDDSALEVHVPCTPQGERGTPALLHVSFLVPRDALTPPTVGGGGGSGKVKAELRFSAQASRRGPPVGGVVVRAGSAADSPLVGDPIDLSSPVGGGAQRGVRRAAALDVTDIIRAAIERSSGSVGGGGGGEGGGGTHVEVTFTVAPTADSPCESRALLEGNAGWIPPARRLRLYLGHMRDATAPTVAFIPGEPSSLPSALTRNRSATFAFAGVDHGSGVAGYRCALDLHGGNNTAAEEWVPCTSPYRPAADLADGAHDFAVVAVDNAGNLVGWCKLDPG